MPDRTVYLRYGERCMGLPDPDDMVVVAVAKDGWKQFFEPTEADGRHINR